MSGIEVVALVASIVSACVKTASMIKEYQDKKKEKERSHGDFSWKSSGAARISKNRNRKAIVQRRKSKKANYGSTEDLFESIEDVKQTPYGFQQGYDQKFVGETLRKEDTSTRQE